MNSKLLTLEVKSSAFPYLSSHIYRSREVEYVTYNNIVTYLNNTSTVQETTHLVM